MPILSLSWNAAEDRDGDTYTEDALIEFCSSIDTEVFTRARSDHMTDYLGRVTSASRKGQVVTLLVEVDDKDAAAMSVAAYLQSHPEKGRVAPSFAARDYAIQKSGQRKSVRWISVRPICWTLDVRTPRGY